MRTHQRTGTVAILLLAVSMSAATAAAQTMSYSAFSDAYGDDNNVYGYGDLQDYGGCAQGSPTPSFMELYSPTRYATGGSSVGMSYSAEDGNWTVVSHFSFTCNCAPYGGSHTFTIGNGATDLVNGYIARYRWSGTQGDCVSGLEEYDKYNCNHQCQQNSKCFPRVNNAPEWYDVTGARVFGKCTPGVPLPHEQMPLCHAGWE